jgi:hypothetical protein
VAGVRAAPLGRAAALLVGLAVTAAGFVTGRIAVHRRWARPAS